MGNNVTFIIGNGLDLSLRLKTSYSDFYQYVKKNSLHPSNSIYKAIEKEDPEYWADFELGLGRFTNEIEKVTEKERTKWARTLNDELDEIKRDLKLYTREQNNIADEHIPNIVFDRQSFYTGLETGQISNIERHFTVNRPLAMRFITLNYTDVLEKLFPSIGSIVIGQNYYIAEPIHHIHGSIHRRISLGVNDESQLSSYIDTREKRFLIKPELIRQMNDERLVTLSNYINSTDVMVLFGVSLGATDQYIWNAVVNWLSRDASKLLIIHTYERGLDVDDLTERESLRLSDRVKDKLLDYSGLDEDSKNSLRARIYVIPNTTVLFTISKS